MNSTEPKTGKKRVAPTLISTLRGDKDEGKLIMKQTDDVNEVVHLFVSPKSKDVEATESNANPQNSAEGAATDQSATSNKTKKRIQPTLLTTS